MTTAMFGHRYTVIPDSGVVELHCGTHNPPTVWEVGYHPSLDVMIGQARAHDIAEHDNDSAQSAPETSGVNHCSHCQVHHAAGRPCGSQGCPGCALWPSAEPKPDAGELIRLVREAWDKTFVGSAETHVDVRQAQIAVETVLAALGQPS